MKANFVSKAIRTCEQDKFLIVVTENDEGNMTVKMVDDSGLICSSSSDLKPACAIERIGTLSNAHPLRGIEFYNASGDQVASFFN